MLYNLWLKIKWRIKAGIGGLKKEETRIVFGIGKGDREINDRNRAIFIGKWEKKENKEKMNEKELVAVVRCKDCGDFVRDSERMIVYCRAWGGLNGNGENDYCSYGKRREEVMNNDTMGV